MSNFVRKVNYLLKLENLGNSHIRPLVSIYISPVHIVNGLYYVFSQQYQSLMLSTLNMQLMVGAQTRYLKVQIFEITPKSTPLPRKLKNPVS